MKKYENGGTGVLPVHSSAMTVGLAIGQPRAAVLHFYGSWLSRTSAGAHLSLCGIVIMKYTLKLGHDKKLIIEHS
jgi:hypothetical protein